MNRFVSVVILTFCSSITVAGVDISLDETDTGAEEMGLEGSGFRGDREGGQLEQARRQGVVVRRGPVVYAYPIPTKRTEDTKTYSNLNGKKSGNPDFKCWTMEPTGSFSYALASGKTEFAQGKSDDILDAGTRWRRFACRSRRLSGSGMESRLPISRMMSCRHRGKPEFSNLFPMLRHVFA